MIVLLAAIVGLGAYALDLRDDLAAARAENEALAEQIRDLETAAREPVEEVQRLQDEIAELQAALEDAATLGPMSCGNVVEEGAGVSLVTAENVDCATALDLARMWQDDCFFSRCDEAAPIDGYTCRMEPSGEETVDVTCSSGDRIVRFEAGS